MLSRIRYLWWRGCFSYLNALGRAPTTPCHGSTGREKGQCRRQRQLRRAVRQLVVSSGRPWPKPRSPTACLGMPAPGGCGGTKRRRKRPAGTRASHLGAVRQLVGAAALPPHRRWRSDWPDPALRLFAAEQGEQGRRQRQQRTSDSLNEFRGKSAPARDACAGPAVCIGKLEFAIRAGPMALKTDPELEDLSPED